MKKKMTTRIILASASPRRRELLAQAGIPFEVIPAQGEEKPGDLSPEETVRVLSLQKAAEVAESVADGGGDLSENLLVIGADTVVSFRGEILGKPRDRVDAARMLRLLSGHRHEVWTGVTVIRMTPDGDRREITFAEHTDVDVAELSEEEIGTYLSTGEADDKAGAYGIQGRFGIHILSIRGDYNNVVGLPIASLYRVLRDSDLM